MIRRKPPTTHDFVRSWQALREGRRRNLFEQEPGDEDEEGDEDPPDEEPDEPPEPDDEEDIEPSAEPEPEPEEEHHETPEDSLDNQIDSFLVKFEKEAVADAKNESRSRRRVKRGGLWEAMGLNEAPEDEEDDSDEEEDEEVTDRSEPDEDAEPAAPKVPPIDIDVITQNIARLINNYESMLDVPRAIFDRATKYLEQNYSTDAAEQFKELLASQHGIDIDGTEDEYPLKGPPATGAEGVPSAGGGGGGALGGA